MRPILSKIGEILCAVVFAVVVMVVALMVLAAGAVVLQVLVV